MKWVVAVSSVLAGLAGHGGYFGKYGPWVELIAAAALALNKSVASGAAGTLNKVAGGVGVLLLASMVSGCGIVTSKPPQLNPTVASSVTIGLQALQTILSAQPGIPPVVIAAVSDAELALAGDVSGKTWGSILREMLTTIYGQLPPADQAKPEIAATLAGLEAALATVGA